MNTNNPILEARAFSELRKLVEACEPFINVNTLSTLFESRVRLTPSLQGALNSYDQYIFEDEFAARLDREKFRAGIDPFNEWLNTHRVDLLATYRSLNEGMWDGLKWAADQVQQGAEWVGDKVKSAGSWALSQFPWGQSVANFIKNFTEGGTPIGVVQLLLDLIGIIPASWVGFPIDTIADGLNALIYFNRGMYLNGVISLIAMLPFGDVFKGLKVMFKTEFKAFGKVVEFASKKNMTKAAEAAGVFSRMAKAKTFIGRIFSPVKGLWQVVKSAIAGILRFFSKFTPKAWQTRLEGFLLKNFDAPIRTVEESISLVERYAGKKAFTKLEKNAPGVADELVNAAAGANKNIALKDGTRITAASKGVEDAFMSLRKAKISAAQVDMVTKAGTTEVVSMFKQIRKTEGIWKGLSSAERFAIEAAEKNPEAFVTAWQRSKRLNKAIDAVLMLAKANRRRYAVKIAKFILMMTRDYIKGNYKCMFGGILKSPASIVQKTAALTESEQFSADNLTLNDDHPQTTPPATTQPIQPQRRATADGGECDTVKSQLDQIKTSEVIRAFTPEGGAYGDTNVPSDSTNNARFEAGVNPVLNRLGIEEIHQTIMSQYPMRPAEERVQYVEVLDPNSMKLSVPTSQEDEDARYEDFIKRELEKGTHTEEELRKMVEEQKAKNRNIDSKLNNSTTTDSTIKESQDTFRLLSFKNFKP